MAKQVQAYFTKGTVAILQQSLRLKMDNVFILMSVVSIPAFLTLERKTKLGNEEKLAS
jgi:hypothetical protein